MNRRASKALIAIIVFALLGVNVYAASNLMSKSDRTVTPAPGQALIVFMRSSALGRFISASIFDVTANDTKFIGIMYNGTKVSYDVTPGEHTFMVVGESADFLKATVTGGKTYYALVTPRMGAWKARFSFRPLRQADLASNDFSKWDSATYLVDNTPESEEWAKNNAADVEGKRARYWPAWIALSDETKDTMTLQAEDGR